MIKRVIIVLFIHKQFLVSKRHGDKITGTISDNNVMEFAANGRRPH